jgi:hypothetical protein
MPISAVFRSPHALRAALCGLTLCASACSGIARESVRDSTAAITAQVALAKASLVACRGGDRGQCDTAEKNLEAIASENARLNAQAEP